MYKIISSSSKGNCVIYFGCVMVDCGVPFKDVKRHLNDIRLILLTHEHGDHLNSSTMLKISKEYPLIRFGVPSHLVQIVLDIGIDARKIDNISLFYSSEVYNYGLFKIAPIKLYHDVPNFGYRIFKDGLKVIHCTDTAHLDGIEAKGYDLYAIEGNYCENKVKQIIKDKKEKGETAYQVGSINSHLSIQQAQEFYIKNKKESSQIVYLHQSDNSL